MSSRPEVAPGYAAHQIGAGAFLLDVRQLEEWAELRIDGAVLIPLAELGERIGEIPTDQPVIVVCRSGNRSGHATDALRAAGIDAVNLAGGMNAWTAAGLPTRPA
jgi:rhodanese-related sulfurtransferase